MRIDGFHRLTPEERLLKLQQISNLTDEEIQILKGEQMLPLGIAEHLIENVVGYFSIPLGVATHFKIDGIDRLIPMAVEETSIIAAASSTAKWVKNQGRVTTTLKGRLIIGQIQIPVVKNFEKTLHILELSQEKLIQLANSTIPRLLARGGGVKELLFRRVSRAQVSEELSSDTHSEMLVIHIYCDPCDAMGANLINQICETLKPEIEKLTEEKVGLCILSNLVDSKLATAEVVIENCEASLAHGIQEASIFAESDPYRAATHNKGVMNGIDPILIATGNDWRAVEAGVHAYCSRSGKYQPITTWRKVGRDLVGKFEAPLVVGVVGGVTKIHPTARVALKILGITHAEELARICAAVGLVQNLGALKALSTVGIVKGHMQLHASNLAIAAGAEGDEVSRVKELLSQILIKEKSITFSHAQQVLTEIRNAN